MDNPSPSREIAVEAEKALTSRERHKGTGDVLKDLRYAQRYLAEYCESDFPTSRARDELRFAERALRVAAGEIALLRGRLAKAHK